MATVIDLAAGGRVAMQVPGDVDQVIGFESNAVVLVTAGHPHDAWLLRCDATSGSCERAMHLTAGIHFARLTGGF